MRAAKVELMKLVAHNLATAFRRAVPDELIVKELEPAAIDFFGFGCGMRDVVCRPHTVGRYTNGAYRIE
jgi:hypothetical protein